MVPRRVVVAATVAGMVGMDGVASLPSGAAGCAPGTAAVGGFHFNFTTTNTSTWRPYRTGPLDVFGTYFTLNNATVNTTADTVVSFATGTDIAWSIVHEEPNNLTMRGILWRVAATTSAFTVTADDIRVLQPARACDAQRGNVTGWTHRDRTDKAFVSGTMRFDAPARVVTVDVTVVYRNGRVDPGAASFYSYNGVRFSVTGSPTPTPPTVPSPPVSSPVVPPESCDVNGCTSLYGYKGHIMKKSIGGLCVAKCTRKFLVRLRRLFGWKCGTCGFGPDALDTLHGTRT